MNLAAAAPSWLYFTLVALLVAAAAEDAWRLRISNLVCLLILLGAIAAAIIAGPRLGLWQNVAVFAGLLALGTPLFAAGKLGGGDVKLIAVCGAWFDLRGGGMMLVWVLLAGGVLALLILALRLIDWSAAALKRVRLLNAKSGIPYGVAVAAGALIASLARSA